MYRAVLDTNVLVSAFMKPASVPGALMREWATRGAFELVLSPAMVGELRRVVWEPSVRKRIQMDDAELESRLAMIEAVASLVEDGRAGGGIVRDRDDAAVLGAALEGRAAFIVTGDEDLLSLTQFEGVAILKPRAFLDLLERGEESGGVHEPVAPWGDGMRQLALEAHRWARVKARRARGRAQPAPR